MTVTMLLLIAAITIGSRVTALAVLPAPRGPLADVVERLPAPLFAALAALSLIGTDGTAPEPAMLAAVVCALVVTRWASLLLTLVAGLSGYLVASLVW